MPHVDPPDIQKQLREALTAYPGKRYGYWGLCQRAGVPGSTVARFLKGERGITLKTAARLAASLKLTLKRRHARSVRSGETEDTQ